MQASLRFPAYFCRFYECLIRVFRFNAMPSLRFKVDSFTKFAQLDRAIERLVFITLAYCNITVFKAVPDLVIASLPNRFYYVFREETAKSKDGAHQKHSNST